MHYPIISKFSTQIAVYGHILGPSVWLKYNQHLLSYLRLFTKHKNNKYVVTLTW